VRASLAVPITLDHEHLRRKFVFLGNWKRIAVAFKLLVFSFLKHHEMKIFGRFWYREVRDFLIPGYRWIRI